MYGLSLGSTTPMIYRAIIDATNFGAKAIVDHYENNGIKINSILCLGGIPQKSKIIMQSLADILQRPCQIVASEECCALGSAILGANLSGYYDNMDDTNIWVSLKDSCICNEYHLYFSPYSIIII